MEGDIVLGHELPVLHVVGVLPPFLPVLRVVGCDAYVTNWGVEPNIEHLDNSSLQFQDYKYLLKIDT